MGNYPQKQDIRPENSQRFVQVINLAEHLSERLSKVTTPQFEGRREIANHLVTLASSILVVTLSLTTAAWETKRAIIDVTRLDQIWCGLALTVVTALMSLWYQLGASSFLLQVWNQNEKLNAELNKEGESLNLAETSRSIIENAVLTIIKFDRRSKLALRISFILFVLSMIDLVIYGLQVF